MHSITVNNKVTFYYTDSGPPPGHQVYPTIIILHGFMFHSGIFERISSLAASKHLRIIALNRREYPGTTPYTHEERRKLLNGIPNEQEEFMQEQGLLITLAVDGLIQQLSLPGKVTLAGWSLGTAFLISAFCSIKKLPAEEIRERLKSRVQAFVLLDTATYHLGVPAPPGAYSPLFDDQLSPEHKLVAFDKWISSYYQHSDLASRDSAKLQLSECGYDEFREKTCLTRNELERVSISEPLELTCEIKMVGPEFAPILVAQADTLLYNRDIRAAWGEPEIWCLYGEATVWTSICGSWYFEERLLDSNKIRFESMPGANHFFIWDDADRTIAFLKTACCKHPC